MKQSAVEWLESKVKNVEYNLLEKNGYSIAKEKLFNQAKEIEEKLQLELVNKFVFDYTYNYRGNKTLYEYVDEWHKEYKRLEEINKNK